MYCNQRSQYKRLNSKKNSFRRNYSRKYGNWVRKISVPSFTDTVHGHISLRLFSSTFYSFTDILICTSNFTNHFINWFTYLSVNTYHFTKHFTDNSTNQVTEKMAESISQKKPIEHFTNQITSQVTTQIILLSTSQNTS